MTESSWEMAHDARVLAPDEDPREWDDQSWNLCTDECPEDCWADHKGEQ